MSVANLCSWLFLLGLAPFAFCFACLLDGETQIWLRDLRVAFCLVVFVSCSGFYDLPCYMTTCVRVEFISNCFFTCEDRALERDRPYRKKKSTPPAPGVRAAVVDGADCVDTDAFPSFTAIQAAETATFQRPELVHRN